MRFLAKVYHNNPTLVKYHVVFLLISGQTHPLRAHFGQLSKPSRLARTFALPRYLTMMTIPGKWTLMFRPPAHLGGIGRVRAGLLCH